jgi:hypothetical protein
MTEEIDYPIWLIECMMPGAEGSVLMEIAAPDYFRAVLILQGVRPGIQILRNHGIKQKGGTS